MRAYNCVICGGVEWVSSDVEKMTHFHNVPVDLREIPVGSTSIIPDHLVKALSINTRNLDNQIYFIAELIKTKEDAFKVQDMLNNIFTDLP